MALSNHPKLRALALVLLGALAVLAQAPLFAWPLAFVGLSGLLLAIHEADSPKRAFWDGWFWGFGYFLAGLHWIVHPLLVDAQAFAWMIPFAVTLLPGALAFFIAAVAYLTRWVNGGLLSRWLFFAVIWVAFELLRAVLFTGFPWHLLGYMAYVAPPLVQFASIAGVYGVGLVVALLATVPALLLRLKRDDIMMPLVMFTACVLAILAYGQARLTENSGSGEAFAVRLVQPNIPQQMKWEPEQFSKIVDRYLSLTAQLGNPQPDVIIWPEASLPLLIEEERSLRAEIARIMPADSYLIMGGTRVASDEADGIKFWNSLFVMNARGEVVSSYDKHHLVPFGEFVPLREYLPFVNKITPGDMDFSSGEGPVTLDLGEYPPFSPLICYEAIFPHQAVDSENRASWLVNITNDAWFGRLAGPHQHATIARMRAIEQGLPLVRVANTGISAVYDSRGRVLAAISVAQQGLSDITIEVGDRSVYSRIGDVVVLSMLVILGLLGVFSRKN